MNKKQKKMLKRIIVASILFIIIKVAKLPEYIEIPLFLVAYLEIGYDILLKAFKGIRNRQVFDENFLMAVATVGAIGLKSFDEATAVMLFYQIGEWFQSYAVGKSRKNITELMDIRPDYANVEDEDGNLEQVDPDEVEIGTIIVVKPGEKVAIDGIVVEGVVGVCHEEPVLPRACHRHLGFASLSPTMSPPKNPAIISAVNSIITILFISICLCRFLWA